MSLERPLVRAPELPPAEWINTPTPVRLASLRGRVVLLDLWDFTCINCLNTLPYLRAWYERYAEAGLVIVGVHTPEFSFARARDQVEAAAGRLGIRWPVVLDNDQAIWTAYANRYWPTVYLIDPQGYIRLRHAGDRGYASVEAAIQELLRENDPAPTLPEPRGAVRAEDEAGSVCYPATPELHYDSVGNPEPPLELPILMEPPAMFEEGRIYLRGLWKTSGDGLTLAGRQGELHLTYRAAAVHAVLSPSPDPIELALQLDHPIEVEIQLDSAALPRGYLGEDCLVQGERTFVRVDSPRMYRLIRQPGFERHTVTLRALDSRFTFYAFSFDTCLAPHEDAALDWLD